MITLLILLIILTTGHFSFNENDDEMIEAMLDESNTFDSVFDELIQFLCFLKDGEGRLDSLEEMQALFDEEDKNYLQTTFEKEKPRSENYLSLFVGFLQYSPTMEAKQEAKEAEQRHEEELEELEEEYSGYNYIGGRIGCTKKTYKMFNNRNLDEEDDWGAEDWRRHSKHGNHGSKGQRKWIIETKARKEIRAQKYSYNHLYV